MKFGKLILREVIKIVASRCHILYAKMHQIQFPEGRRRKLSARHPTKTGPQAPHQLNPAL